MIELIKACLIVNIVVLVILLAWVIAMGIWHFKKDKKHQEEKAKLEQSRDWHIKELKKRSENEDVDLH
jgi:flagellar basal body-associated protein FliL